METFDFGNLGQPTFDHAMIVSDIDMGLPWYGDTTLQNPKSHPAQKTMNGLVPFTPPRDLHCETMSPMDHSFGLNNGLLTKETCPTQVSEDPITAWTRASTPSIKAEDDSASKELRASLTASSHFDDVQDDEEAGTGVDVLMKAIQTKCQVPQRQLPSPPSTVSSRRHSTSSLDSSSTSDSCDVRRPRGKMRYQWAFPSCGKTFTLKGRLSVHSRALTGHKPYV